jgi:hypothetical protein
MIETAAAKQQGRLLLFRLAVEFELQPPATDTLRQRDLTAIAELLFMQDIPNKDRVIGIDRRIGPDPVKQIALMEESDLAPFGIDGCQR